MLANRPITLLCYRIKTIYHYSSHSLLLHTLLVIINWLVFTHGIFPLRVLVVLEEVLHVYLKFGI